MNRLYTRHWDGMQQRPGGYFTLNNGTTVENCKQPKCPEVVNSPISTHPDTNIQWDSRQPLKTVSGRSASADTEAWPHTLQTAKNKKRTERICWCYGTAG